MLLKDNYTFPFIFIFYDFPLMANEIVLIGFYILTLVYSVMIHEVAHGVVALWLGDMTAKYADRLNLNPLKHIDPFGSIILPLLLFLSTGFAFGFAKPVPYNPYNLRDQKWGPVLVALAGPGVNFLVAFIASFIAKMLPIALLVKIDILDRFIGVISMSGDFMDKFALLATALSGSLSNVFFGLLLLVIFWNVVLGCFNLLPVPPLDGSKLLYALVPIRERTVFFLEQYGMFLLLIIIFFFSAPISIFINFVLSLFLRFSL
ncbi:MAG: site-2 protease family protein [Candidatus Moranbacteria bacterium CG_4_10_14_3_um_filter_41_65]|nr:MAG: hypothetical protein COX32_03630 [Candidatus Moranbacteria bacterium CG23_combo_of_CG06-09_8_20_14_all_41_28]PIV85961.1 MAG: site-2 protease family protein [Candidatus Moranbacteria bacterium CG17_big_fil_post_rev_8_21_14_2_50_41_107]PIW94250.1 MAG: site-2 protease family protein [Candidatus Moranbacteria bacterium CG_4_8_14_3_um_filter_41_13]PIX91357.1 MAG: site-2 protease family protein [Candidatus Moranbacteria bacterium CG_4_10_14_3_um_filter_41_65]PJC00126.1 MAG: site-2 protease fa